MRAGGREPLRVLRRVRAAAIPLCAAGQRPPGHAGRRRAVRHQQLHVHEEPRGHQGGGQEDHRSVASCMVAFLRDALEDQHDDLKLVLNPGLAPAVIKPVAYDLA